MADKVRFKVLRRHEGDRMYEEGEVREGTEAELGHLVPRVLERIDEKGMKSEPEPAPANKMELTVENKAEVPAATHTKRNQGKKRGR